MPPVKVQLVAIGTELVALGRRDTNSEWVAERLARAGVEVVGRTVVDDDVERIAALLRFCLDQAPVAIVSGGLGPTEDDRTRDALARAFDAELEEDPERLDALEALYRRHGLQLTPGIARQALRPRGSRWIDNPLGSAAGILLERQGRWLAALPGVPAELRAMFDAHVLPRLRVPGRSGVVRRTLKFAGRGESSVDDCLRDLYRSEGLAVTVLGGPGLVEVHLIARDADPRAARSRIGAFEAEARRRLGDDLVGVDEVTAERAVGELLVRRGMTLATAESCTAGLLGAILTSVPGASAWYRGGFVVYADELKRRLVGVQTKTIARHGAVSEAVARELAAGARERCGADLGIGITGVAGPGGGTRDKPVGLVHLACDTGSGVHHRRLRFVGDRRAIRERAAYAAIDLVRRRLLEPA